MRFVISIRVFIPDSKSMAAVKSSCIKSIDYDKDSKLLTIHWHSGSVSQHSDISPEIHKNFLKAKSKGGFFHQNIARG